MKRCFIVLVVISVAMSGDIGLLEDEGEVHTITVDGFGSNLRFVPDTITINEGDTVRFLWSGQLLPHNAIEQNELFNSGEAMRNVDYTYTFDYSQSGVYEFYCEPHRDLGMIGEIIVDNVEQNNTTVGGEVETKTGDYSNDVNSNLNISILLGLVFAMLIFIYLRTRIDDIAKI